MLTILCWASKDCLVNDNELQEISVRAVRGPIHLDRCKARSRTPRLDIASAPGFRISLRKPMPLSSPPRAYTLPSTCHSGPSVRGRVTYVNSTNSVCAWLSSHLYIRICPAPWCKCHQLKLSHQFESSTASIWLLPFFPHLPHSPPLFLASSFLPAFVLTCISHFPYLLRPRNCTCTIALWASPASITRADSCLTITLRPFD